MAGDLVLIVLKVKLIVIGQLEREEGRINARTPEGVGGGQWPWNSALGNGREEGAALSLTQDTSSHLLSFGDSPAGDDDDFILLVKRHNFRHTVRGTRMVDVPKQWARVGDARQLS